MNLAGRVGRPNFDFHTGYGAAGSTTRNTTDETSTTIDGSSRKKLQQRLEAEFQIFQIALDASVNYGAKRRRGLQKELLVDGGGVCRSLSSKTRVNTNC